MSASQDKSQKFTFIYLNLYKLQKKMKEEVTASAVLRSSSAVPISGKTSGQVLKAADLQQRVMPRVDVYRPASFLGKRIAQPHSLSSAVPHNEIVESLKENLKSLNELHSRLKFMLQELEECVKD